jgi:hypothetical protein
VIWPAAIFPGRDYYEYNLIFEENISSFGLFGYRSRQ